VTVNGNRGEPLTELIARWSASGDLAVLVAVERQRGTVGELPAQDWSLRITLVFRREGDDWRLLHRHADPLTRPIHPELMAAIARGDHAASG